MVQATQKKNNPAARLTSGPGRNTGLRPSMKALIDTVDRDDPAFMFIAAELHRIRRMGGTLNEDTVRDAIAIGREQKARHQQYEEDTRPGRIPPSIVYYARRGNAIKIGTTTQPAIRFRDLLPDEILAWEPGSRPEEAARHAEFSDLRVTRCAEYFHRSDDLEAHMQRLRDLHGNPDPTWPTLGSLRTKTMVRRPPAPAVAHMAPLVEAARRLGIREGTARAWVRRGKIRPIVSDSHGKDLYLLADLKALAEAGRKQGS